MFTVTKITERHDILSKTIGTTPDENRCYVNAQVFLNISVGNGFIRKQIQHLQISLMVSMI